MTSHPCIVVIDISMAVMGVDVLEGADMSFGALVVLSDCEAQIQVCVGHLQSSDRRRYIY